MTTDINTLARRAGYLRLDHDLYILLPTDEHYQTCWKCGRGKKPKDGEPAHKVLRLLKIEFKDVEVVQCACGHTWLRARIPE